MDKAITTELASREKLMASLRNRNFQLAIFADLPEDRDLYCQRSNEDRLCVSFPPDQPLAQKKGITFDDLKDISVIAAGNAGYWIHVCEQNMPKRNLVVQDNVEVLVELVELVESSSMPVFSSQHLVDQGNAAPGCVTVPITDEAARAMFYLACLQTEKQKYVSLFNALRSQMIRTMSTTVPFLSRKERS